ncbi:ATP-binding protein [Halobacteriaceae archaeon GCM10025711]
MKETTGNNADTAVTGRGHLSVAVANIGGIAAGRIAFEPGVTVLSGANASNKSSLLQGLMAVLGGPDPTLKGDVDHGEIRLDIDGEEYALEVSRRDGGVVTDGTPFSDERDRCRLFASLDEMNPVRRAVVGDGDLHDLLMRPVDTDEIEAEISRLEARKASVAERLDEVERLEDRLPSVEAREQRLEDDLDAVEADLADVRQRIQDAEADQAASTEVRTLLDDLEAKRTERETVRDRIRTQESALDSSERNVKRSGIGSNRSTTTASTTPWRTSNTR